MAEGKEEAPPTVEGKAPERPPAYGFLRFLRRLGTFFSTVMGKLVLGALGLAALWAAWLIIKAVFFVADVRVQLTSCTHRQIAMLTTNRGGRAAPAQRPRFELFAENQLGQLHVEEFADDPFEATDEVVAPGDEDVQIYRSKRLDFFRQEWTGGRRCWIRVHVPIGPQPNEVSATCNCAYRP